MKKRIITSLILSFCVLIGVLAFFQGCETESASDNSVVITPEYAAIEEGQSLVLTASGGYSYEWSLSNPEWGLLTDKTDTSVRYTSTYQGSSDNEVQTIAVRSYIEGASSTTNGVTYEHFAYAYVTHYSGLSISPETSNVNLNESVTFTASGGDPDEYVWSLSEPGWGMLTYSGSNATYTRTGGDDDKVQILTVAYNGKTAEAVIIHTGDEVNLSVSPSSASVTESGDVVSFTASGDDTQEYSWWLYDSDWGELTQSSDTEVSYIWNGSGDGETQILYCRNAGETVQAAIVQNSGGSSDTLSISPANADVEYLGQVLFTASGGEEDTYSWSLSEPSWGDLSESSVNQAVYTRTIVTNGGIQYVTVDNGDESVKAVVIHVNTNGTVTPPTP